MGKLYSGPKERFHSTAPSHHTLDENPWSKAVRGCDACTYRNHLMMMRQQVGKWKQAAGNSESRVESPWILDDPVNLPISPRDCQFLGFLLEVWPECGHVAELQIIQRGYMMFPLHNNLSHSLCLLPTGWRGSQGPRGGWSHEMEAKEPLHETVMRM